jgi:hypothetical protein
VQYQDSMNYKILSVTVVVAASLAALASMPLTTTPAYAGGNAHVNNVNNHATDSDADFQCFNQATDSCDTTTTVNNPPGPTKCYEKQNGKLKEIECPT